MQNLFTLSFQTNTLCPHTHSLSTQTLCPHTHSLWTHTLSTHSLHTLSPHTLSLHALFPHNICPHTHSLWTHTLSTLSLHTLSPHTHTLDTLPPHTYATTSHTFERSSLLPFLLPLPFLQGPAQALRNRSVLCRTLLGNLSVLCRTLASSKSLGNLSVLHRARECIYRESQLFPPELQRVTLLYIRCLMFIFLQGPVHTLGNLSALQIVDISYNELSGDLLLVGCTYVCVCMCVYVCICMHIQIYM